MRAGRERPADLQSGPDKDQELRSPKALSEFQEKKEHGSNTQPELEDLHIPWMFLIDQSVILVQEVALPGIQVEPRWTFQALCPRSG